MKRLAAFLTVIGIGALALAPTAGAAPPTHDKFSVVNTATITDICPFSMHLRSSLQINEAVFTNANGDVRITDHVVEQDVFSAHGTSIETFPYHYTVHVTLDDSGFPTQVIATGIVIRAQLPDGSLFQSAGRVDTLQSTSEFFTIVPQHGHSGNVAAFCAALS